MAYGRLDVLFPDGNFRSFPLVNSTESIGRSTGNTIKLDAETISRYHISITRKNGTVILADLESQNGTYVDGVKIPNGEQVELRGGEEILIGELRIIYHVMDDMPTQPVTVSDETTEIIQDKDAPFQLSVQPPPIAIPPGAHASAELTITNTSDVQGFYTVTVDGVPRNWVRLDRPKVLLEAHESGQVVINLRPTRHPETAPGDYTINITVQEESHAAIISQASTRVRILPYGGFGIALEEPMIDSRDRFRLHLHNQGSAPLPLVISGSQRTANVKVNLVSSANVTLAPGQRLVIQGSAKPVNRKLMGKAEQHPFDILVRSQQANEFVAVVEGQVLQPATLPSWLAYGIGGLVFAFGVLLFLAFQWLIAPNPMLTNVAVAPLSVARGDDLTISWTAFDIQDLVLQVDETPIAELTPNAGIYTLNTEYLAENAVITLSGSAGRRQTDPVQQRIQVYEPMHLATFSANPPQLVEHVVTNIDLSWNVENAEFVRLIGVNVFSTDDIDPTTIYQPADSLTAITGITETNLTLEIYAEDTLGNVFTDTIVIESIPAQCSLLDDPVTLRNGPNPLNQSIGTIPPNTTVTVAGRDISGAWVAVEIEGGLLGWGALDQLNCADTFNPANLRQIIDITPPPAPSETPTFTPTPIPTATPTPPPTLIPTVTREPSVTPQPPADNEDTRRAATSTPSS